MLLARAGLARLGRLDEVTEVLDPLQMLPAPGQGALAVECRADDASSSPQLRERSTTPPPGPPSTAERAVLADPRGWLLGPVGALAEVVEGEDGEELWLRAVALSPDGALSVRRSATGPPDAPGVGRRLAEEMLADGARRSRAAGPERPHDDPVARNRVHARMTRSKTTMTGHTEAAGSTRPRDSVRRASVPPAASCPSSAAARATPTC